MSKWTSGSALLALLLATACAGVGNLRVVAQGVASSVATTAPPPPPTTSVPVSHDDQAAVGTMLVEASDLPPGWESSAPNDSTSSRAATIDTQLSSCLQANSTLFGLGFESASAASPDFSTNNDDAEVQSIVKIEKTGIPVQRDTGIVNLGDWLHCVNAVFWAVLPGTTHPGIEIPDTTGGGLTSTSALDQTFHAQTTVSVSSMGLTRSIYVDVEVVRKGRVVAVVEFISAQTPFDPGLEQHVMTALTNRVVATNLG